MKCRLYDKPLILMQSGIFTTVLLLSQIAYATDAMAQAARFVAIGATNRFGNAPTLEIGTGEVAYLEAVHITESVMTTTNISFMRPNDPLVYKWDRGPVVGPVTIFVRQSTYNNSGSINYYPTIATVKVVPELYDLNKTVVIQPSGNKVSVSLELSTNLVSWTTATNGNYGGIDKAHFFRIKAVPVPAP